MTNLVRGGTELEDSPTNGNRMTSVMVRLREIWGRQTVVHRGGEGFLEEESVGAGRIIWTGVFAGS